MQHTDDFPILEPNLRVRLKEKPWSQNKSQNNEYSGDYEYP